VLLTNRKRRSFYPISIPKKKKGKRRGGKKTKGSQIDVLPEACHGAVKTSDFHTVKNSFHEAVEKRRKRGGVNGRRGSWKATN